MGDDLDDLFKYLKSPYLEYDDYRNKFYCGDVCIHYCDEDVEGIDVMPLDLGSLRDELLIDYYMKQGYSCESGLDPCDFSKENSPEFISELKFYFEMLDKYFNDGIGNIDFNKNDEKHYLYRVAIPKTRINTLNKFVNNLLTSFIKLIICGKII